VDNYLQLRRIGYMLAEDLAVDMTDFGAFTVKKPQANFVA
jgi:hypothetical protein